jgi:hypothetical protein
MVACSLILMHDGDKNLAIEMKLNNQQNRSVENIIEHYSPRQCIFSDRIYTFKLKFEEKENDRITKLEVYINNSYEPSEIDFQTNEIRFPQNNSYKNRQIFIDCYGFVEIGIKIYFSNGTNQTYVSNEIPVWVRKSEINYSVKEMAKYIYQNQRNYLTPGNSDFVDSVEIYKSGKLTLLTQIRLAEEIATLYESSYSYFKVNSRFKIEKRSSVESFNHIQYISEPTIRYIASNPEQLIETHLQTGIRIGKKRFQPQKALTLKDFHSYDIYENRVILGFIRKMIEQVKLLHQRCKKLLDSIPKNEEYYSEYIYSPFFMFVETKVLLEENEQRLIKLSNRFKQLWVMYQRILNITPDPLNGKPYLTAIFFSVPQYNKIYINIYKWIDQGLYDYEKERFMLSFIKISSLYELYILVKLISYFQKREYTLIEKKKYRYSVSLKSKYKNVKFNNTFVFSDDLNTITLYYQPVIFNSAQKNENNVGLFRNNSIPCNIDENLSYGQNGGYYYVPDYIIKIDLQKGQKRYIILDAKFSKMDIIKKYYIKNLVFKYLFSLSAIEKIDQIVGMGVIHGKCSKNSEMESAYDRRIENTEIFPFLDIIPIAEGINNEQHFIDLDKILRKTVT